MDAHTPDLIPRFAAIVGERHALTEAHDRDAYLAEPRGLWRGEAEIVLRPGSVDEVSQIMKLAEETGTPVVPQSGNTGLVGGQVAARGQIVLSLDRLTRIREIDPLGDTMTAEAGVILADAQVAAEEADRLFPLSLAAEGSCRIGGNLATNAGGTAVLAYGNARDLVLGLEVVLADGRVWNGLRKLRKDNTGYDLKHLFVGAEGTLGIITAAVLKLFPRPRQTVTAIVGVGDPKAALSVFEAARSRTGSQLTTCELIPRIGLDFVLRHIEGARDPLATPHDWYVLLEFTTPLKGSGLRESAEAALAEAMEAGALEDAAIAESEAQRRDFWRLREMLPEAQKPEGGSIKHDVSVPVSAVPAFIARAMEAASVLVPGCRPVPFGHIGDGNVHFNVSQPEGADNADYLARWDEMNAVVHAVVAELNGSISAEHGIGQLKRHLLPAVKDRTELELMRAIKTTLDPKGLLNPGKVL